MDVQSILSLFAPPTPPASLLSLGISIVGVVLAIIALRMSTRESRTTRVNSNSWETYHMYNSAEIKDARRIAREVGQDPNWGAVRDYSSYRAYFRLDEPLGGPQDATLRDLRTREQDLHYLLGYYHQVGTLLGDGLMDENFTLLLLGGGLRDRWPVLGRIPLFYDDQPYSGIYALHERFLRWDKQVFPGLIHDGLKARARAAHSFGITDASAGG